MIGFVSIEHESWLESPEHRLAHDAYCMDVKLKVEAMTGHTCLVQDYRDVTHQRMQALGMDALLISGNAADWCHYAQPDLAGLCDLIRAAEWPILGLCGGHQLIAMAHGAAVAPMRRLRPDEPDVTPLSGPGYLKEWGFLPVSVVEADPVFGGLGTSPVFLEVHHWEVKELPPGFRVLASSRECLIQAMRRVDRPVYGVQFHPEGYSEGLHDRSSPLVNLVYPDGYAEGRLDGRDFLVNFFRVAGVI